MFDDQNTPQPHPPTNLPSASDAEDIFAPANLPGAKPPTPPAPAAPAPPGPPTKASMPESPPPVPAPVPPSAPTPPVAAPPQAPPVAPAPMSTEKPAMPVKARRSSGKGVMKALGMILVALFVIGVAAALAFVIIIRPGLGPDDDGTTVIEDDVRVEEDDDIEPVMEEEDVMVEDDADDRIDSDGDGLTDAEEAVAGTSATKMDTDEDGLGDREEVQVYGTDPLDADTDGDTYLDGAEVAGGYNPNGPGKLFEIPK